MATKVIVTDLSKYQAQRYRSNLKKEGWEKTDSGMERGMIWTRWEKAGQMRFVECFYSLTPGGPNSPYQVYDIVR